jgi:hypothetical protein
VSSTYPPTLVVLGTLLKPLMTRIQIHYNRGMISRTASESIYGKGGTCIFFFSSSRMDRLAPEDKEVMRSVATFAPGQTMGTTCVCEALYGLYVSECDRKLSGSEGKGDVQG